MVCFIFLGGGDKQAIRKFDLSERLSALVGVVIDKIS